MFESALNRGVRPREGTLAMMSEPNSATWRSDTWWAFVIAGVLWMIFTMVVLQSDIDSVASIGIAAGLVMLLAALTRRITEIVLSFHLKGLRDNIGGVRRAMSPRDER